MAHTSDIRLNERGGRTRRHKQVLVVCGRPKGCEAAVLSVVVKRLDFCRMARPYSLECLLSPTRTSRHGFCCVGKN